MNDKREFAGFWQSNISVQEMIRFRGVTLKMSANSQELGGYASYFTDRISVNFSRSYWALILIIDYPIWPLNVMTLGWFKQSQSAFHPKVGQSKIGVYCHTLRHAHNALNQSLLQTFIPDIDLSFDEGDIPVLANHQECMWCAVCTLEQGWMAKSKWHWRMEEDKNNTHIWPYAPFMATVLTPYP
jgi:hypothetical protein